MLKIFFLLNLILMMPSQAGDSIRFNIYIPSEADVKGELLVFDVAYNEPILKTSIESKSFSLNFSKKIASEKILAFKLITKSNNDRMYLVDTKQSSEISITMDDDADSTFTPLYQHLSQIRSVRYLTYKEAKKILGKN